MSLSLEGYRILEPVYEGPKSLVYRAQREADGCAVVLKTLRSELPSVKALSQLKREYDILRRLKHPCVVTGYDLHAHRRGLVLVLEDFGGMGLGASLRGRRVSPAEFFELAFAILDGLAYVHEQDVVHKDLNPANLVYNAQTRTLKLIDFGISSLLRREKAGAGHPSRLEGTLAYIAPEQTGRVNRTLDFRCDFYALGVTFFELLAGRLPFPTSDPMEMVHSHIAKKPPFLHDLDVAIAQPLAQVIDRLLAKNAEDRYQSHHGLRLDLDACRDHMLGKQTLPAFFEVGRFDSSERLAIPEKRYGRDGEAAQLAARFEASCAGATELVLVTGAAGIGKSTLISEMRRPVIERNGAFISGKFDQFQRNIPYASLVQAFTRWARQVADQNETVVALRREQLLTVLGDQAQVMIDVIPALARVLGPCAPVADLPPAEAQNRFNLVFQQFVHALPTIDHPMFLFLDDLQWADSASLKLLCRLLLEGECAYLTIVGAFRDGEIEAVHPVREMLVTLEKAGCSYERIHLEPLEPLHVNQLLAETLHCSAQRCLPLTDLCMKKTNGNPFYLNRFVYDLYERGLIFFDTKTREWVWDEAAVQSAELSENVLDFMVARLEQLPETTQRALKIAACIGNRFPLYLLAVGLEEPAVDTAEDLWPALAAELIEPLDEAYKFFVEREPHKVEYRFQHDRVQQAAYALIEEEARPQVHLDLARCLQDYLDPEERERRLFDIVNHFNIGRDLLTETLQRDALAALNGAAGRRAILSSAYEPAYRYFQVGIALLGADGWSRCYAETLELHQAACEAAFLVTEFEEMQGLAQEVHRHAHTLLDKVRVYAVEIDAMVVRNRMLEAIDLARPWLKQLGIFLPRVCSQPRLVATLLHTKLLLMRKPPAYLIELPLMKDPHQLALMRLIGSLFSATHRAAPSLFPYIVLKVVQHSLRYGNAPISAFGFACYGLVLCGALGEIEPGNRFGSLGLSLLERLDARRFKTRTAFVTYGFIRPWREHLREVLEPLREAYVAVNESGDIEYASHAIYIRSAYAYFSGAHLPGLLQEMAKYNEAVLKLKQMTTAQYHQIFMQAVHNLMGATTTPWLLSGTHYREEEMLPRHVAADDKHALFVFYLNKAVLAYWFHQHEMAEKHIDAAFAFLEGVLGFFHGSVFYFWRCLIKLARAGSQQREQRRLTLRYLHPDIAKLRNWKQFAPMNFRHKVRLIEAEKERVLGDKYRAFALFDQAIAQAGVAEFLQERALANELCAGLCFEMGNEKVARSYLQDAFSDYEQWGANAKMRHIQHVHPSLSMRSYDMVRNTLGHNNTTFSATSTTIDEGAELLDLSSVVKASQTISGEIVLGKLLEKLMIIVIENAGAEKGILLREKEGRWVIEGESHIESDRVQVLQGKPLAESDRLSHAVVQFVARTGRNVVLDQANKDPNFGEEAYFSKNQTASVLCIPLLNQGKTTGILYLENNLSPGVFTTDRLEILQILSSQIAVSIENARLYSNLEYYSRRLEFKVEERTRELTAKTDELMRTQRRLMEQEKMASLGTLTAGIAHEIKNPLNFVNNFSEINLELLDEIEALTQPFVAVLAPMEREELAALQADLKRNSEIICNHGKRANSIVQSMMMLSKGGTTAAQPTDLNQLVSESLNLAYHGMRSGNRRFSVALDQQLAEGLPIIDVVPQDLGRVFLNLVNNSLDALYTKFCEQEHFQPQLQVTTQQKGDWLKVIVRDNGGGIPDEIRSKIFNPFFTTKPTGGGNSGLGLSISYDVVAQDHGGRLEVYSEKGVYTEFHVWLPLACRVNPKKKSREEKDLLRG